MIERRRIPKWDPTNGNAECPVPDIWLDPSDSSTLLNTVGGAITDGATIGTWTCKDATARAFTQWGANARPTWVASGINGLGAVRCQSQILTTRTSVGVFDSLGALTLVRVCRRASSTAGAPFNETCLDTSTGHSDITRWGISGKLWQINGWRVQTDSFATFNGDTLGVDTFISCGVWDFANAQASVYQSGVKGPIYQSAFGTAGTTPATGAYALTIGGFAQESGLNAAGTNTDGYAGEILLWLRALTADQLVSPQTYVRLKWAIN